MVVEREQTVIETVAICDKCGRVLKIADGSRDDVSAATMLSKIIEFSWYAVLSPDNTCRCLCQACKHEVIAGWYDNTRA